MQFQMLTPWSALRSCSFVIQILKSHTLRFNTIVEYPVTAVVGEIPVGIPYVRDKPLVEFMYSASCMRNLECTGPANVLF